MYISKIINHEYNNIGKSFSNTIEQYFILSIKVRKNIQYYKKPNSSY